jgi:hypothetical protein
MIPYLDADHGRLMIGLDMDIDMPDATRFTFPLSPDHQLLVLVQFNVLRGLLTNMSILSLLHTLPAECGAVLYTDAVQPQQRIQHPASPFSSSPSSSSSSPNTTPFPPNPSSLPLSLRPTALQCVIPHDAWIDAVPWPGMRDALVRLSPQIDRDELCDDVLGGLYEGFNNVAGRGVILWGEPWRVEAWEVSEGFARRWGALLLRDSCDELLEATQRFREVRGEERTDFARVWEEGSAVTT